MYLVPSLTIAVFLDGDGVQTVRIDLRPVRHGHRRMRYSLVLSLLSFLSYVTRPTTNVASNFFRVLLLHIVVDKDLQHLFCSRDPILELAKVHAGKASAWLPFKQGLIGGVRFICETW